MSASWQGLLQNFAILAILVTVWTPGLDWIEGKARWWRELFGAVLAGIGVILMMLVSFEIGPGVITDLRGALIALAGFLGSPLIGVTTALVAAAYRFHLDGIGATAGVLSIIIAAAVGVGGHMLLRGRMATKRDIFAFAIVSAASSVVGFFVLPHAIMLVTFAQAGLPVAVMSFVAAMVAGLTVVERDRRRDVARTNLFYRAIIDALPEPLNAKDIAGRFLAANPATARQLNAPDVPALIGKSDFDFHPEDIARQYDGDEARVLERGEAETIEQALIRKDGSRSWLSTLKSPLRDSSGTVIGLLTHNRDITERKRMEDEIAEGRRRLNDAMENMADGLVMFDKDARIVLCNDQYRAMFPATADLRVAGARLADILRASIERGERAAIPRHEIDTWIRQMLAAFVRPGEHDIHLQDGRWLSARVRPAADGGSLMMVNDITQSKHAEAVLNELNLQLTDLASKDGLTGLTNRRGYDEALAREFSRSSRSGVPLSLLLVDVDRFKTYNDTYGHPAGDECLRTIGNLLKLTVRRPGDIAARNGGDEFAAILPDTPEEGAVLLADTVRKRVRDLGLQHSGNALGIATVSIGVATLTATARFARPEELVHAADVALYAAKAAGHDRTMTAAPEQRLAATG